MLIGNGFDRDLFRVFKPGGITGLALRYVGESRCGERGGGKGQCHSELSHHLPSLLGRYFGPAPIMAQAIDEVAGSSSLTVSLPM